MPVSDIVAVGRLLLCMVCWFVAQWLLNRNRCVILRLQVIFRLFRDNLTNKSLMTLALVVGLLFLCY